MKNKLTLLLLLASSLAIGQTKNLGSATGQRVITTGDTVVNLVWTGEPKTPLRSNWANDNRFQRQTDRLLSGGTPTTNGTSNMVIAAATYYLNAAPANPVSSSSRTFTSVPLAQSGKQKFVFIYGKTNGTIDTLSGAEVLLADSPQDPTLPANTVQIARYQVTDSAIGSPTQPVIGGGFVPYTGGIGPLTLNHNGSFKNLSITGTGGTGYLSLAVNVAASIPTPSAGVNIFTGSANSFGWVGPSGFKARISSAGFTGGHAFVFPDVDGTIATINGAQTFTSATWNAGNVTAPYIKTNTYFEAGAATYGSNYNKQALFNNQLTDPVGHVYNVGSFSEVGYTATNSVRFNVGMAGTAIIKSTNTANWTQNNYSQLVGLNGNVLVSAGSSGVIRKSAGISSSVAGTVGAATLDEAIGVEADFANSNMNYIVGFKATTLDAGTNNTGLYLGLDQTLYPGTGNYGIYDVTAYPWYVGGSVGTSGYVLTSNGTGSAPTWQAAGGGGGGTVTSVSSANGDATVATGTTTPVITIVSAPKLTTGRTIAITGDLTYTSPSFDGSGNVTASGTLATVNSNVGGFSNANITVDGKGRITAASNGAIPVTSVTGTANRITVTGTTTPVIDISSAYVGQSSITTLGTIGTGVWNGTAIADANIATSYIKADGTRPLTGNWDMGNFYAQHTQTGATASSIVSGFKLYNNTAAALGAQQNSGALEFLANAYKTNATATSQPIGGRIYMGAMQGAAAGSGYMSFETQVANGGYSATNAMYLTTGGNLGLGTSAPNYSFTIQKSSNSGAGATYPGTGITNTLGTQGNGTSTFNLAAARVIAGNGTVSSYIVAEYDATYSGMYFGTSTAHPVAINTTDVERIRILSTGQTGFGISNASATVHIKPGTPVAGTAPLKFDYKSIATTAATGNGTTATITFASQPFAPFPVGSSITIAGMTPSGYNGTYTVTAVTTTTVSFLSATTGVQTVAGTIVQGQLMTTPEVNAVEYDGTALYMTNSLGVRRNISMGTINNVSSAGTLALATGNTYTFNGTTATYTLPPISGNTGGSIRIINAGSGIITLNANTGGSDIWESGTTYTTYNLNPGDVFLFYNNSLKYVISN